MQWSMSIHTCLLGVVRRLRVLILTVDTGFVELQSDYYQVGVRSAPGYRERPNESSSIVSGTSQQYETHVMSIQKGNIRLMSLQQVPE